MKYERLIGLLQDNQTSRVRAIHLPNSCTTHKIPEAFELLIPDIIEIIHANIKYICQEDQIIAIFGLQFGPPAIQSAQPIVHNRIFYKDRPTDHLCLTMQYLLTTCEQLPTLTTWSNSKTMLIDLTTGALMDNDRYLSIFENKKAKGRLYGILNSRKLEKVWRIFNEDAVNISSVRQLTSANSILLFC